MTGGAPHLLEAKGLTVRYGGLAALDGVDLTVEKGELVALVGPNGAGKTTLFNVLTGTVAATAGDVFYEGRNVTRLHPHQRARAGIVRTWQIARPFPRLTVLENVLVAALDAPGRSVGSALLQAYGEREATKRAREALDYVGLDRARNQLAGKLSGGQRKLLEMARALMLRPRVLLLDEPFAGVNPTLARDILNILLEKWREGLTIVLVEHNMELVMQHCPRVVVLDRGRILVDGTPVDVRLDPRVIEAYLGGTI